MGKYETLQFGFYLVKYKQKYFVYDTKKIISESLAWGSPTATDFLEYNSCIYRKTSRCIGVDPETLEETWETLPLKYEGKIIGRADKLKDLELAKYYKKVAE